MPHDSTHVISTFNTPAGWLCVTHDEHHVHRAVFTQKPGLEQSNHAMAHIIANQLDEFSKHPQHIFELPIKPQGTPYQLRVWNALRTIPAGLILTYGELARILKSAPRAIGQACKRNPIALFIPCHRVVGPNSLGGYMGRIDLPYKTALLKHEFLP